MAKGLVIGLTGGIASGKSTVSHMLSQAGLPIVDADQVAHMVEQPGGVALTRLVDQFSDSILQDNGQLDRQRLGQIVFNSKHALAKVNAITQPLIRREIARQTDQALQDDAKAVILDVPLLFEEGYDDHCDSVVVVKVKPAVQLKRLMKRNGLDRQQAQARIDAQMSLEEKARRADIVIDNNGDQQALRKAVNEFLKKLPGHWQLK